MDASACKCRLRSFHFANLFYFMTVIPRLNQWRERLGCKLGPAPVKLCIGLAPGLLFLIGLTSCNSKPIGDTPLNAVTQPTIVNLYPSTDDNRLFIFVRAVGSQTVSMPLDFDTGSAGITLDARRMNLPPGLLTPSGFLFPAGANTIFFNGITITNQQATREYGGANGTLEHGNIAFAPITFGDSSGHLTTGEMPIFLYYSITDTAPPHAVVTPYEAGIFGVDNLADEISVSTSAPPQVGSQLAECTQHSTGSCYTVSVLKYLVYAGVDSGFALAPSGTLPPCHINVPNACAPKELLTVGLSSAIVNSFSTVPLECPPMGDELPTYYGPATVRAYQVCEKSINDSTVTLSVQTQGFLVGRVLFDSGTPDAYVYPEPKYTFPSTIPDKTSILISLPSGFMYSYTSVDGTDTETSVNADANNQQTHIGVGYFTTNSFLIDYTTSVEGWK